jgi:uncharacterized tellurite resistance protein B-like protein
MIAFAALYFGLAVAEENDKYANALIKEKRFEGIVHKLESEFTSLKENASKDALDFYSNAMAMLRKLPRDMRKELRNKSKIFVRLSLARHTLETAQDDNKSKIEQHIRELTESMNKGTDPIKKVEEEPAKLSEADIVAVANLMKLELFLVATREILSDLVSDRHYKTPFIKKESVYVCLAALICLVIGLGVLAFHQTAAFAIIGGSAALFSGGLIWYIVTYGKELDYTLYIPEYEASTVIRKIPKQQV